MAVQRGFENNFGIQKAETWGTLVDATTNDLLPVTSESLNSTTARIANMELNDSRGQGIGDKGLETVNGNFKRYLHYHGDHQPLSYMFGTAGTPVQVGTTSFYTHQLSPAATLEGIFCSLFSDRTIGTLAIDSAKIAGVVIEGSADGYVTADYSIIGRDYDPADDLTWGSVTENAASVNNFVTFGEGTYLMNTHGGLGLAAGTDDIYPSSFRVEFQNNFTGFTTSRNWPNIDEPVTDGFLSVSGSYTIPIVDSDALTQIQRIISHQALKTSLEFATGSYSLDINIPYCVLTGDIPGVDGEGRQTMTLNWVYERAESAPTGMDFVLPYIDNVNADSVDPLA